jgi:WD40 repeat protein
MQAEWQVDRRLRLLKYYSEATGIFPLNERWRGSRLLEAMEERVFASVSLSGRKVFKSAHTRGILSLALEQQTENFLLSGALDGSVAIYRLTDSQGLDDGVRQCSPLQVQPNCVTGNMAPVSAVTEAIWYPSDLGLFATTGMDGIARIWDTHRFQVSFSFSSLSSGPLVCGAFYANILAIGTSDPASIRLCDLASGAALQRFIGHGGHPVNQLVWLDANTILSAGSFDRSLIVWDLRKQGILQHLQARGLETAHEDTILAILFKPPFIYSWSRDSVLRRWSSMSLSEIETLKLDSRKNASSRSNEPSIAGATALTSLWTNKALVSVSDSIFYAGIGKKLALLHREHSYGPLKPIFSLPGGHLKPVTSLILSRRHTALLTAGTDAQILFWEPSLV